MDTQETLVAMELDHVLYKDSYLYKIDMSHSNTYLLRPREEEGSLPCRVIMQVR